MIESRLVNGAAAILAMLSLGGCVGGLLGGGKPDRLYRFGAPDEAVPSQPQAMAKRRLVLSPPQFAPAVSGDRVLTTEGRDMSYVNDMRWVSTAPRSTQPRSKRA